jgi:virginiamycin B lyase
MMPRRTDLLRTARVALVFLAAALVAACGKGTPITSGTATPAPTPPPAVTSQYPIPTKSSQPEGITLGADGNLWITEFAASKIGQLAVNGKISDVVTPTRRSGPFGTASGPGPNLNVWFTEESIARVGQITTSGPPYVEYTLPNPAAKPVGIALGSDGNMWVTDPGTNSIWRVEQLRQKPHIKFTQFPLAGNAQPLAITNGPDGALWFTEPGTNSIGRIPISGSPVSEYKLTTSNAGPAGITPGSDNALWFTEQKKQQIGRIAVTGVITAEYPLPGAMTPDAILQGVDGNFYFTDTAKNKMGQFFFRGHHVNFYSIPTANSEPTAMTLGTDEQIYFVETAGNKVGQFRYFNV